MIALAACAAPRVDPPNLGASNLTGEAWYEARAAELRASSDGPPDLADFPAAPQDVRSARAWRQAADALVAERDAATADAADGADGAALGADEFAEEAEAQVRELIEDADAAARRSGRTRTSIGEPGG